MSQNAYIKLVEGSAVPSVSLEELRELLNAYRSQLELTAQQLDWEYENKGFPYTIETAPNGKDTWFYLKGNHQAYRYIVTGVGSEDNEGQERHYIQVVLPDGATHGDKSKANEFCKHLARKLKAELHLFNGRVMYYNPRK
jgi:hypothetical protein